MDRLAHTTLKAWKGSDVRKPLIIRGARQIGKTTCVRHFGQSFTNTVELNFERRTELHALFEKDLAPEQLITDLQVVTKQTITPGKTLLFFDEVQACPRVLIALRYFFEKMPALHVIAAGSLLEFAIEQVGVPVGRVNFLHMYPMSFLEFLWALDERHLADVIFQHDPSQPVSSVVHDRGLRLLGEYMAVGGMPEAVAAWRDRKNYQQCLDIHHDLIAAFEQDFEKYAKETQIKYVEHVFRQAPYQLGRQFQYAKLSGNYRKRELSPALELLVRANIMTPVFQTSGQGIPLGADANPEAFKAIFIDVALTQALLGLTAEQWILDPARAFVNKGALSEAFVGQECLAYANPRQKKSLYYWQRNRRGSEAEVDYLMGLSGHVIPVEVKAGKGSTLKSMNLFLNNHPSTPYGIRFSAHNYSIHDKLHTYPLYAVFGLLKN